MGILNWLNTSTEDAQAQKLEKKQKNLDAQRARLNKQPGPAHTGASLPAIVSLSQSFASPGITFTPSETMRKQVLELMGSKLTLMPVYVNGDGKIFTHESFEELQKNSEFPLQGILSARYVGTQPDAAGNAVILDDPVPPEDDIQAYLAALIAGGYKPLCTVTVIGPPAAPAPAPSNPQPNTEPPAEQNPPDFTGLAIKKLGYAPGTSLSAVAPDQLAALTKCANELQKEYEKQLKQQKAHDDAVAKVTIATERVVGRKDPEFLADFLALVEAASLRADDADLDQFTDESQELLQAMNPQMRTMLSTAATNNMFQRLLGMIELDEFEENGGTKQSSKTAGIRRQGRKIAKLKDQLKQLDQMDHEKLVERLNRLARLDTGELQKQLCRKEILDLLTPEEWRDLMNVQEGDPDPAPAPAPAPAVPNPAPSGGGAGGSTT